MSIEVMTLVWKHYPDGGSELLLALALADHADDDGSSIYPSVASMAKKVRQSERNIQYLLGKMVKKGWLEKVQEGGIIEGRKLATMYRMPIERIPPGTVGWVQTLHPSEGCNPAQARVQPSVKKHTPVCTPTVIEPSKEPSKPASAFALPDWIQPDTWKAYEEIRKKIRKPMTERARDLIIKKLLEMKQAGQDANAVLEQSVMSSWPGIFPIKADTSPAGKQQPWWTDDQATLAKAKELGVSTNGISWQQLRSKIREKIDSGQTRH